MRRTISMVLTLTACVATSLAPGSAAAGPYDSSDGETGLGSDLAQGDFNGDGKADLARGHRNERDYDGGSKEEIAAQPLYSTTASVYAGLDLVHVQSLSRLTLAADFNADGKHEVVLGTGSGTLGIYTHDRATWNLWQALSAPAGLGRSLGLPAAGDFNSDGLMDLAV